MLLELFPLLELKKNQSFTTIYKLLKLDSGAEASLITAKEANRFNQKFFPLDPEDYHPVIAYWFSSFPDITGAVLATFSRGKVAFKFHGYAVTSLNQDIIYDLPFLIQNKRIQNFAENY